MPFAKRSLRKQEGDQDEETILKIDSEVSYLNYIQRPEVIKLNQEKGIQIACLKRIVIFLLAEIRAEEMLSSTQSPSRHNLMSAFKQTKFREDSESRGILPVGGGHIFIACPDI